MLVCLCPAQSQAQPLSNLIRRELFPALIVSIQARLVLKPVQKLKSLIRNKDVPSDPNQRGIPSSMAPNRLACEID